MAKTALKKVIFIRFSSIGDIVLCSAATRCLKLKFPEVEIHFATKEAYAALAASLPGVAKVHCLKGSMPELIRTLKQEEFDLIVDLHHNFRSARLKIGLGIKHLSFHKENFRKWKMVRFKQQQNISHVARRYVETMQSIGVEYDGLGLELNLPNEQSLPELPEEFIAVAVGAKFRTKEMPTELMVDILKPAKKHIVLLGGPDDQIKAKRITSELTGKEITNYCGALSILESAGVIAKAMVLLTGDTGLMHIAAAKKTPTVSVWGNTVPQFGMYPLYPDGMEDLGRSFEVWGLSCRPCSKIGYSNCPKSHFDCMKMQDTASISEAIQLQSTKR